MGAPWEEVITVGTQYFDPAFAPTHQRFDYDNLFSGKINLFTDVGAAAHLGFAPLGAASMIRLRPCLAGFVPGATCWIGKTDRRSGGWLARRHGSGVGPERRIARRVTQTFDRANSHVQPGRDMAHSLGRIICYDAFSQEDKHPCAGRYLVTFGSQIANPFLKAAHFTTTARVHN